VIDLKRFFGLPDEGLTDLSKVIVLESEAMSFGILADGIAGTRTIPLTELQAELPTLTGIREKYLKAVTNDGMAILDGKSILSDRDMVVTQET
jgi:purine-binding chemotaxis protein CheW